MVISFPHDLFFPYLRGRESGSKHNFGTITRMHNMHRSDSIQGTDYIATPFQGFLGQKLKI